MKHSILIAFFVSMMLHTSQQTASAFPPSFGSSNRTTTSPYLNLLRNRNQSTALNYYRSYKPEVEFRQNEQLLGRSIRTLQNEVDRTQLSEQQGSSLLGTTGHPTTFGNTSSYFPTSLRR